MRLHVVPGQIRWLWCPRCASFAGLEVGVYVLPDDGPPELVGTFSACSRCDPDVFGDQHEDGVTNA